MTNWERKSSYLLKEIVKYRTYIDSLRAAQTQKEKLLAQRAVEGNNTDTKEEEKEGGEKSVPALTEPIAG